MKQSNAPLRAPLHQAMTASAARALCFIAVACGPVVAAAQTPSELPGAQDHPAVGRYKGSVLQNASVESFAQLRIPLGPGAVKGSDLVFTAAETLEGKISAFYYVQPSSTQPLEVFRNYQNALQQAGFKTLYSCELQACSSALIPENYRSELLYPRKWAAGRINPGGGSSPRELRYWSGKAQRAGTDVVVIVWVTEPDSIWNAPTASVVVVEPRAMEGGKVAVSMQQLERGLQAEGKMALYGLYFDTGKAQVKPESKPQLDEMAKLLQARPALKVFIVGHTDNQGTLEGNVQLSQRRAEAVVAALVSQHALDASRMAARGVANLAPVASNVNEAGRAKNRRVEMVAQ